MKNTELNYMYRDASNYKLHFTEVLKGSVSDEEVESFNADYGDIWFYPGKIGLNADTFVDIGYKAYEDDPNWHELLYLKTTEKEPTVELSVDAFINAVKSGEITGG
jgi:hypothetical protein